MDDASADLLRRLVDRIDDRPMLVVVTRRDQSTGFVPDPDSTLLLAAPGTSRSRPQPSRWSRWPSTTIP